MQNYGLYQLYSNIVAYLVLLEGGVGSALLYRLYKPVDDDDKEKLNSVMSAGRTIFNLIGLAITLVGVIISFFITFFTDTIVGSKMYMQLTFLLFLASQVVYYFVIPERSFYEAKQKKYVPNIIYQVTGIVKSIVEIIIVYTGHGLTTILTSLLICSLASNVIICILFKRNFKYITFKAKKDFSMLKDVKDLFINTIGNLVTNNIDIILISKFIGVATVPIYSAYNYLVESIRQFTDKVTGATLASVGNLLVGGKEKAVKIFNEFNHMMFYMASIICVPLFVIINKFIEIWYEGKIQTSTIWAILFVSLLLYQIIRIPLKVFTLSSGKFKKVKNFVILEIIINLTLSIFLINRLGITGILIGTVVSLLVADFCTKPIVIYKELLDGKYIKYYIYSICNIMFTALSAYIYYIILPKDYSNIFACLGIGALCIILNTATSTIYYSLTKQFTFKERILGVLKRTKKRSDLSNDATN